MTKMRGSTDSECGGADRQEGTLDARRPHGAAGAGGAAGGGALAVQPWAATGLRAHVP